MPQQPDRSSHGPRLVASLVVSLAVVACGNGSSGARGASTTPSDSSANPSSATFTNPLNDSGPDPWMKFYQGNYYFAATTWGGPEVGLTMRKAPTIQGIKDAQPVQIYQDSTASRCCNYWAPEFFLFEGPDGEKHWYGYFTGGAADSDYVHTQFVQVIESEGTDPMGPYTYKGKLLERPALDASVLELGGKRYAIYSEWNETQDVAIKEMSSPWETTGEETVLTRPTLPWELHDGTVNEGPVALYHDGRTFIVYSASACWGPDYELGILTYQGGDPLSADSWKKSQEPVFKRDDAHGVYGPGHNNFFMSPDSTEYWIIYHANDQATDKCDMGRSPRIQKFTWNADGTPAFGLPVSTDSSLAVPSRGGA